MPTFAPSTITYVDIEQSIISQHQSSYKYLKWALTFHTFRYPVFKFIKDLQAELAPKLLLKLALACRSLHNWETPSQNLS